MFDLHHDVMFFVFTVLGLVFYMTFQVRCVAAWGAAYGRLLL